MGKKFRDVLDKQLEDPAFKEEWEALEPEFQVIRAMMEARQTKKMSQKELSEKTGIDQADISRIENGNANPSLSTLQRLANGLDMTLKIDFVPKSQV